MLAFRSVREDLNILLEFEELLFDVADAASLRVLDEYLGCEGDDFEAKPKRIVHTEWMG